MNNPITIRHSQISVFPTNEFAGNKRKWGWQIKTDKNQVFSKNDLYIPLGTKEKEVIDSFLGFLSAFVEAVEFEERSGRKSENSDLFPADLKGWAVEHQDEILLARLEGGE